MLLLKVQRRSSQQQKTIIKFRLMKELVPKIFLFIPQSDKSIQAN